MSKVHHEIVKMDMCVTSFCYTHSKNVDNPDFCILEFLNLSNKKPLKIQCTTSDDFDNEND